LSAVLEAIIVTAEGRPIVANCGCCEQSAIP
jgi:hypothetical protein